jgi:hypothetical protein
LKLLGIDYLCRFGIAGTDFDSPKPKNKKINFAEKTDEKISPTKLLGRIASEFDHASNLEDVKQ